MQQKQATCLILAIVGLLAVVVVVVGLGSWGWNMFEEQVVAALEENPVIQQHIGSITDIEIALEATGETEGDTVFVFRIEGPKGSGLVTADIVTVDEDTEEIRSGILEMSTGETFDLMEH